MSDRLLALKKLVFPGGLRPRRVLFGAGRGLVVLADPASGTQRLLGLAEAEIAHQFVRYAKRCATACDVGASDGWYCLLAHKHNRSIRLIGIEPDPQLKSRAQENFVRNGITDTAKAKWIARLCGPQGVALDDELAGVPEPILIKIDIEGGELEALQSGARTLASKACYLVVETHSTALEIHCKEFLQKRGYQVRIIPQAWFRALVPERRPLAHNQWLVAQRGSS
jgi:hypothetical protein